VRKASQKLWNDDSGALVATEWVFVATIMVLGAITGLVAVRQAILSELTELADAVISLNRDGDKDQDKPDNNGDDFNKTRRAGSRAEDVNERQFLFSNRPASNKTGQAPETRRDAGNRP
jgi:hypothetical protein